ncbi:MAG: DUF2460 domain-containing protein [Porticoccus sp.]|nr:DUF2460 domain-containing protein [Porticoccus sp.]
MSFIEERFNESFSYGSGIGKQYAVEVTVTAGGNEYRKLSHPYPVLTADLDFSNRTETWVSDYIRDLYDRSLGMFGGLRWKNPTDYSTNARKGAPTYNDQACVISGTDYQIVKWYGTEGGATASRRRIRKPVTSTTLVGIRDDAGNPVQSLNNWTVDTTTGLITFSANNQKTVTSISQAASAVVGFGTTHSFIVNDTVHLSSVSGMAEINGLRGTVTATGANDITVDIDSTLFTAFAVASPNLAVVNTSPQSTETVAAGCEFDIPVRFDSDSVESLLTRNSTDVIMGTSLRLIELLNP